MTRDIDNGKRRLLKRGEVERSVIVNCDNDNFENLIEWICDLQDEIVIRDKAIYKIAKEKYPFKPDDVKDYAKMIINEERSENDKR